MVVVHLSLSHQRGVFSPKGQTRALLSKPLFCGFGSDDSGDGGSGSGGGFGSAVVVVVVVGGGGGGGGCGGGLGYQMGPDPV